MIIISGLNYSFKEPDLLQLALTHRSKLGKAKEADFEGEVDNQRLEFLGDAVLNLFIGEFLFLWRPRLSEGEMSKFRSILVCESRLAEVARNLELGSYLFMSSGEIQGGGRDKPSILADAMEALLGALYIDGGAEEVKRLIAELWAPYLSESFCPDDIMVDYKSRLQILTQGLGLGAPLYEQIDSFGPAHKKTFVMGVSIENRPVKFQASARSKKEAEQLAAKILYQELSEEQRAWPDKENNETEN